MATKPAPNTDICLTGHGSVELHGGYHNAWRQLLLWASQEHDDECCGENPQLDGILASYS